VDHVLQHLAVKGEIVLELAVLVLDLGEASVRLCGL
jgi:hypothetical protein